MMGNRRRNRRRRRPCDVALLLDVCMMMMGGCQVLTLVCRLMYLEFIRIWMEWMDEKALFRFNTFEKHFRFVPHWQIRILDFYSEHEERTHFVH